MQDSNYVYINMEYSKLEPLGAFFLITFIGIMAIQVCCHYIYIQKKKEQCISMVVGG